MADRPFCLKNHRRSFDVLSLGIVDKNAKELR